MLVNLLLLMAKKVKLSCLASGLAGGQKLKPIRKIFLA